MAVQLGACASARGHGDSGVCLCSGTRGLCTHMHASRGGEESSTCTCPGKPEVVWPWVSACRQSGAGPGGAVPGEGCRGTGAYQWVQLAGDSDNPLPSAGERPMMRALRRYPAWASEAVLHGHGHAGALGEVSR